MSKALTKAFDASHRSFVSAKQSVSQVTNELLARAPSGLPVFQPDLFQSHEQLLHFRGWVYASIRPIAQRIAAQQIFVGKVGRKPRGTKRHQPTDVKPLDSHELLDLFHDPNDLMVAWSLIYTTVASLELTGRCLWSLPKKEQILPIPTSWIRGFEGSTRFTSFKISPPHSAETFNLPSEECCYFNYPNPADPHGALSPLQAVAGAVEADESICLSQVQMFRKGIHPDHVVLVGKDADSGRRPRLSGAQQRQIINAIRKRYGGVVNDGEPIILDALIEDVKRLSNTPQEMNWLESGQITKERILQGFGTNEIILGSKEANRASAAAADKHFCQYTVNPKIELLSQVLTEWLRPQFGEDLVIWIEPCVANDADMQLKWATALARHSAITGDELRSLSPFNLGLENFPDPVSKPTSQEEQNLEVATRGLKQAVLALEENPLALPNRIADRIVKGSKVESNGRYDD